MWCGIKKRWNDLGAKELDFKQWEAHIELAEEIDGDYAWSPVPVSNVSSALAPKDVAIGESQTAERQLPRGGNRQGVGPARESQFRMVIGIRL